MFTALGAGMPVFKAGLLWMFIVASVLGTMLTFSFRPAISLCKVVVDEMQSGLAEFSASPRMLRSCKLMFSCFRRSNFSLIAEVYPSMREPAH